MRAVGRGWFIGVCACIGLAGCPASSTGKPIKKDAGAHDAGFDAGSDDGGVYCPPGSTDFNVGGDMQVTGRNGITAKLFDAMPAPPERYTNVWIIDFVSADGKPIEDLKITKAQAFMPYHVHGRAATVSAMPEPGRFKITLNFFMRGYFEAQLTVSSVSAGVSDYVAIGYCVQD